MNLQTIRKASGLSVDELAQRMKIRSKTWAELESGARTMDPEAIPLFLRRLVTRGFHLPVEPPPPTV